MLVTRRNTFDRIRTRRVEHKEQKRRSQGGMGRRKKKGECVRDEELLIRNRPEHTHTHTYCSDIMDQECCTKEPTTERDGRGGGLAFSLWQGERKGNMEREG